MCKRKNTDERIKAIVMKKRIEITDISKGNITYLQEFKGGAYFLYNDDELFYIGITSLAETSNLYIRLYGNGSGSHNKKNNDWFGKINKAYFFKLPNESDTEDEFLDDLYNLERLLIRVLNPSMNDKKITEEKKESILNRINQ